MIVALAVVATWLLVAQADTEQLDCSTRAGKIVNLSRWGTHVIYWPRTNPATIFGFQGDPTLVMVKDTVQVNGNKYLVISRAGADEVGISSLSGQRLDFRSKIPLGASVYLCKSTPPSPPSPSSRNVVRVISDLHIGSPWFKTQVSQTRLMTFLKTMTEPNTNVRELVLLGDIVEFWMTPLNVKPSPPELAFQNTNSYGFNIPLFLSTIKAIAANGVLVVHVLRGNHDLAIDADLVTKFYGQNIKFVGDSYLSNGVLFEHGHKQDLFNAPDPSTSPIEPFGFYVSRIVATTGYNKKQSVNQIIKFVLGDKILGNGVVKAFRKDYATFQRTVLQNILKEVFFGASYDSYKSLRIEDVNKNWSIRSMLRRYRGLVKRWHHRAGLSDRRILRMMKTAYVGSYDAWAKRESSDVVIYGHTHSWELKALKRSSTKYGKQKVVLANSGAWIDGVDATHVDLLYDSSPTRPRTISVFKYSVTSGSTLLKTISNPNLVTPAKRASGVPSKWSCDPLFYNANDGCDCECGDWDPDCDRYNYRAFTQEELELGDDDSKQIYNCEERSFTFCERNTTKCAYETFPPPQWTCGPGEFNSGGPCQCGCGVPDPDCDVSDPVNCSDPAIAICLNATCGYPEQDVPVPSGWKCDILHYNSSDGCDCGCGIVDPDCVEEPAAVFGCACDATAKCVSGNCSCQQ